LSFLVIFVASENGIVNCGGFCYRKRHASSPYHIWNGSAGKE